MPVPTPPAGFAEFVNESTDSLLRAAWYLTGDDGKAEDLLQAALIAAWQRWPGINDNPEGYVRRTLYTTYVSWWRRRGWHEQPMADLPEAAGADHAIRQADRDAVRRALARLSRQQRAVVVLRFVEDLSIAETAAVLGCSLQTVKVQSSRAVARMRDDPHLHSFRSPVRGSTGDTGGRR